MVIHQLRHFRAHHTRRDRISSKQLETLQLGPSADAAGAAEGKHPRAPHPHFTYSRLHWSRNQPPCYVLSITERGVFIDK